MLDDHLHRDMPAQGLLLIARKYLPRGTHRESLLMGVFFEDIALPVEPGVGVQVLAVPQKLHASFGVL